MSISYPLALPSSLIQAAQRVSIRHFATTSISESVFTGQQTGTQWAQRWEMDVALKPMVRSAAADWIAFLASLYGGYGWFIAGDPSYAGPRGAATGTPVVNGAAQAGRELATTGWTAGVTGILKAGDLFQLGSGSQPELKMVLADANSDGSGNSTIDVWPDLRTSPANGSALVTASPVGLWRLASPVFQVDLEPHPASDPLIVFGFSCREKI